MKKITQKIIDVIYSDKRENKIFSLEFFLYQLSKIYGSVSDLRFFLYKKNIKKSHKFNIPVVSIGNITSGGTGKTPLAVYLSSFLVEKGYKPAIVMRGYKGGFEEKGGIVSDGEKTLASSKESGDEAFLISKSVNGAAVLCGKNRVESINKAVQQLGCSIIILDDGFSHLKVKRDIDLLLLDFKKPFGNGYILPRGLLREKVHNIKRADAVIYTRCPLKNQDDKKDLFHSDHETYISMIIPGMDKSLHNKQFLFSGLGSNQAFYESAVSYGLKIEDHLFFKDHHDYDENDILNIISKAEKSGCDSFVTTMKDYCRLIDSDFKFPMDLIVMDVKIKFLNENFNKFLIERLEKIETTI